MRVHRELTEGIDTTYGEGRDGTLAGRHPNGNLSTLRHVCDTPYYYILFHYEPFLESWGASDTRAISHGRWQIHAAGACFGLAPPDVIVLTERLPFKCGGVRDDARQHG